MPRISNIRCHKTLDSRGTWTIETHLLLEDGSEGVQTIPDGASKGEHEAVYISVKNAVDIVSSALNEALCGEDAFDQERVDNIMLEIDGTPNKRHLGGNSILSVSLAVAKAAAISKNLPLYKYLYDLYGVKHEFIFPTPVFNVINGGMHAHNNLSFQEFMVIPARAVSFDKAYEMGAEIYSALKQDLEKHYESVGVGDEGGFAPEGFTAEIAFEFLRDAASKKYKVGSEVFFGMDAAADSFMKHSRYKIREENLNLSGGELRAYYMNLLKLFEIIYIEDPFYENDHKNWSEFMKKVDERLLIVGDDLVVTNPSKLLKVVNKGLANAVIVKPNQVGTLTETLKFIKIARNAKYAVVISHRSGDTAEDTFIADLALGVGADFIKAGAPARGERVAKYNRLLEIFYEINQ